MNKVDAALKIIALAREHMPAIVSGVKALIEPDLTDTERAQLAIHIADYENMAAEQRRKADGG